MALADLVSPKKAMPKAREYSLRAINLQAASPEAHVALGLVKLLFDWDWRGAEQEFSAGSRLNPPSVETFSCYLHYSDALGKTNEAAAELAHQLARDPMSLWGNHELGCVSYYARRYDVALDQFRRTISIDPKVPIAYVNAGRAYTQKGMHREAIAELKKATKLDPEFPLAVAELGYAYAAAGNNRAALEVLRKLKAISERRYVDANLVALVYLALGDKTQAFVYLEKAYADRSSSMPWLRVDPKFDVTRSDPRYLDLLRRVGPA